MSEKGFWFHGRIVHINLRSPEDEVKEIFTRGQCHSFALAVHKLTGWELYGFFQNDDMANHVVCKCPNGTLLDITGNAEEDPYWRRMEARPVSMEMLEEWMDRWENGNVGYARTNVEAAIPFAKRVIKQYHPEVLR